VLLLFYFINRYENLNYLSNKYKRHIIWFSNSLPSIEMKLSFAARSKDDYNLI
jgi:hypothetical protein